MLLFLCKRVVLSGGKSLPAFSCSCLSICATLLLPQVTNIYSASSWRHINEHLHDILGKQCAELGDAQGSLAHCTALLDCGHRQAAAQAHYLARFLEAVQAAGATGVRKQEKGGNK